MRSDDARVIDIHESVLQAEGFVALQLGADLDRAADTLRDYAVAQGRTVPQVARDVLDGRVTFGAGAG